MLVADQRNASFAGLDKTKLERWDILVCSFCLTSSEPPCQWHKVRWRPVDVTGSTAAAWSFRRSDQTAYGPRER
ncbi:hypothetical protein I7I53_04664 [Histoplasma capsulatum var. duboisii H88]|uniref:Uncharacterized protein n=1 Tax=Ajellomyces capsulatus (strain H88) TaxID=544711 RepID=A0A8A1LT19_AJEC8|nr:hypothetical protein I7I53_04664 [Histoplasma capsulatum var. duboisii H88]